MTATVAPIDSSVFLYFNDPELWAWFPFRDDELLHAVKSAELVINHGEAEDHRSRFVSLCKLEANSATIDAAPESPDDPWPRCQKCLDIIKAGKKTHAERFYERFMSKTNNRSLMRRLADSNEKVADSYGS